MLFFCGFPQKFSGDWIAAEVAASTIAAEVTAPDGIELLDKRFDKCRIVCQNAILEITLSLALRAHPCARKVRRAKIRHVPVNDDALEVDARAKHSFHSSPQVGIAVEVVAPVRPRLLRMDKPQLDASLQHPIQHLQKRHHVPRTGIDVHILDVVTAELSEGRA